jgi:hypothetical protein
LGLSGDHLGLSRACDGACLDPSEAWGLSWACLGLSLDVLRDFEGPNPFWTTASRFLTRARGRPWPFLVYVWDLSRAVLGLSWVCLGLSWAALDWVCRQLRAVLGLFCAGPVLGGLGGQKARRPFWTTVSRSF